MFLISLLNFIWFNSFCHLNRPKAPAVQAIRAVSAQQQLQQHQQIQQQPQPHNAIGIPMQPSSPKHNNRPSSRVQPVAPTSITNANSAAAAAAAAAAAQQSHYGFSAERTERRKFRVEKKLQEMQQTDVSDREREAALDDVYFDILEFAESNFNTHERTPEGTIIATLTRKGRKSVDLVPKYEMITYYRGNSIQTSHIHMYDPENVTIACNIFKVRLISF